MDEQHLRDIVEKFANEAKNKIKGEYEIFAIATDRLHVESKEGKTDNFERSFTTGVSIRILKGPKMGFSFCTDFSRDSITDALLKAAEAADLAQPDENHGFVPAEEPEATVEGLFDPSAEAKALDDKIKRAATLEQAAREFDSRIKQVRRASYTENLSHIFLHNSLGLKREFRASLFTCQIMTMAKEGDQQETAWEFDFSRSYKDLDVEKVGRKAAEKAVEMLHSKRLASIRCPVILENTVAAEMLEVMAASFLAENIAKGKSMLIGKERKKIFHNSINIIDDGTLKGGFSSFPFDGEGSAAKKTRLVSEGRITNFLYDRYYAHKMGAITTGNSIRAGITSPPRTGPTNFYIEKGKEGPEQLVKHLNRGLWVKELLGIHTADPVSGDFSVGAQGIWIENGEKVHPAKGIAISDNILEIFHKAVMTASDLRFLGNFGAPSVLVEETNISGL